jgi:hypothetical protein
MKSSHARLFSIIIFSCAVFFGCAEKRLDGLAPDQIPGAIARAFEKADPGIRMQAEMAATAVKGNQWLAATSAVNDLLGFPKLTQDQRRVLSQCQITIGERMREMAGEPVPTAPAKTVRKSGEPAPAPAEPATPEEQVAAKAALRIYQQSK